jgi:hypothetical protein
MGVLMSESIEAVGGAARAAGEETIRIPRNVYGLLRQSYDTREKVLDWLLAFAVVGALIYAFRDQLLAACIPKVLPDEHDTPEAGRYEDMQINQNVAGALPQGQQAKANVYTYNLPPSRNIRHGVGPSGTRPPNDPGAPPVFPVEQES